MRSKSIITVISLSPEVKNVIGNAVSLLNSAKQDVFKFELSDSLEIPARATPETARPWFELQAVLAAERKRRRVEVLIGVLSEPIERNWFSHSAYGQNVAWITTHDWEFYSNLPAENFVAYDIVLNTMLLQLVTKPEEEAWLMREVVHETENRECISDLCAYKPDISRKILSGKICPDCQSIITARIGPEALAAIAALLEEIRKTARPSQPTATIRDFPILAQMQKITKIHLGEAHHRVETEAAQLKSIERERDELLQKLRAIDHQREAEAQRIHASKAKLAMLSSKQMASDERHQGGTESGPSAMDRPGLAEQVERRYPFPIAYCFRSMRAELNPTDRWKKLFELYGLIVRYLVFALLSGLRQQEASCPEPMKALIQKLKFGYAGDWGKACIALLKHGQTNNRGSFFKAFLGTLDTESLGQFAAASISLVQTRNAMEHGYTGDNQACKALFERHLPEVKHMLQFMAPMAEYLLIRPVDIVENLDGQCIYVSKVMAGSDPQFLPRQMISASVPQTVCQLLSREGGTLTLHPWVHLSRCDSCLREMVFVYDAIHIRDGREAVLLREYPSNHEQCHSRLVPQVKQLLYL